jgi:hypothetical protein
MQSDNTDQNLPAATPVLAAIGRFVVRAMLTVAVGCAALVWAMLSGFFGGGGGRDQIYLSAVIGLCGAAWSMIPLIRASWILALPCGLAWSYLGFRLSQFGAAGVRGWMLQPWIVASCAGAVLLFVESTLSGRQPAAKPPARLE